MNLQHCLGGLWSRRSKKIGGYHDVLSVKATVTQFNDVTDRVMTTVMENKTLKSHERAAIIKKWIEVAQVSYFSLFFAGGRGGGVGGKNSFLCLGTFLKAWLELRLSDLGPNFINPVKQKSLTTCIQ